MRTSHCCSMSLSDSSEDTSTDNTLTEVNGQDLTHASHEESLEALQSAPEPIIIEVLRRSSSGCDVKDFSAPSMVTSATQTERALDDEYCSLLNLQQAALREMYPFVPGGELMQPSCRQGVCFSPSLELGLTDIEMGGEEDEEPIYDDPWDLRPNFLSGLEIEYEDVTLLRNHADDKLGLTLCYENHGSSDDDEPLTDVYVSEIEAGSIAAQNGRIREGDQILQINNEEIHSRDQAIRLFSNTTNEVTVTIARHVFQVDDGFVEERSAPGFPHFPLLQTRVTPDLLHARMLEGLEEGGSTDTASTSKSKQDSGLGRTDDSIKTEESSEQDCLDTDWQEHSCQGNDSFTSNDNPDMSPDQLRNKSGYACDKFSRDVAHTGSGTYSSDDRACAKLLDLHNHVTGKPPRSPSNRSDSALGGSSGTTSSKSDSSTQSSPSSSYPNPSDHIYDEPLCGSSSDSQKYNTNSSYLSEIDQLNREIETMRIECRRMHESNRAELNRASPARSDSKSPRVVPRMGTRLDYLRQIQAIQQFNQMGAWMHSNHITNVMNGNHDAKQHAQNTNTVNNAEQAYCVSNVAIPEIIPEQTEPVEYTPHQTDAEYKESSNTSAYNTGESCRSTPLTLELKPPVKTEDDGGGGWNMSMLSLAVSNVQCSGGPRTPPIEDEDQEVKLQWCRNNSLINNKAKSKDNGNNNDSQRKGKSVRARPKEGEKCPMVQSRSSVSHMTQTPTENLRELYTQYADVMYTNQANLQHTMMLQQKLFQQQMLVQQAKQAKYRQSARASQSPDTPKSSKRHKSQSSSQDTTPRKKSSSSKTHSSSNNTNQKSRASAHQNTKSRPVELNPSAIVNASTSTQSPSHGQTSGQGGSSGSDNGKVQMEWVVKLRPDGSRYITRRPVRNKMLRERAKKVYEERCGITTDDDAMSELKVGRYWSKDERKRQLEKAREYKKKKELALKQKSEALKDNDDKTKNESNILELSHKKMMKVNNKKAFDNFTTVQEMLVHGNRHAEVTKAPPNPLLSVTTV